MGAARLFVAFSGNILAIGGALWAQSSSPPPRADLPATGSPISSQPLWANRGRWSFGAQVGAAFENDISRNISHISLLIAQPQVALIARESQRSLVHRFEIIGEGTLGYAPHPGGRLLGGALLFRLNGKNYGRLVPFLDLGGGAVDTTLYKRTPELGGPFQFSAQGGLGIEYFFHPQRALVVEYRYLHLSNANLQRPNIAFNGNMISVGFRWLRRPVASRPAAKAGIR